MQWKLHVGFGKGFSSLAIHNKLEPPFHCFTPQVARFTRNLTWVPAPWEKSEKIVLITVVMFIMAEKGKSTFILLNIVLRRFESYLSHQTPFIYFSPHVSLCFPREIDGGKEFSPDLCTSATTSGCGSGSEQHVQRSTSLSYPLVPPAGLISKMHSGVRVASSMHACGWLILFAA